MKIKTIFWDFGEVLFSDTEISKPEFKSVLQLPRMNARESNKLT